MNYLTDVEKRFDKEIRDNAIKEFAERLNLLCKTRPCGVGNDKKLLYIPEGDNTWHDLISDVAEQMKEGENE